MLFRSLDPNVRLSFGLSPKEKINRFRGIHKARSEAMSLLGTENRGGLFELPHQGNDIRGVTVIGNGFTGHLFGQVLQDMGDRRRNVEK